MSSQILITGATGFIGRRLTRDLLDRGKAVRILARNPRKARELFGDHVEISPGELNDQASLEKACGGIKTVFHIAGSYRFGMRHHRELWRSNVDGTDNLLRSAAKRGVDKVVHLSSGGVLGKDGGACPEALVNEDDFPTKAPRFCSYKASKWHSEQKAFSWSRQGLPVVIASTTCPIGPGDEMPTPTGRMIQDFLQGRFPFYCRTGLNFIDVGDLSLGLQQAAELGQSGRRYLLSNENLWLKEFLDLLSLETGLPAPEICLPGAFIRLISLGGEAFDFLNPRSSGARVCLETALQVDRRQFFDNTRTREELEWTPTSSLQESVREAVTWFRQKSEVDVVTVTPPPVQSHVQ